MKPEDVAALVEQQIRAGWDPEDPHQNPHGVDLERCLLNPPARTTVMDSFDSNHPVALWLVLREEPEGGEGYRVVFDDRRGEFGLVASGPDGPDVLIGCYGSFLEALAAM